MKLKCVKTIYNVGTAQTIDLSLVVGHFIGLGRC